MRTPAPAHHQRRLRCCFTASCNFFRAAQHNRAEIDTRSKAPFEQAVLRPRTSERLAPDCARACPAILTAAPPRGNGSGRNKFSGGSSPSNLHASSQPSIDTGTRSFTILRQEAESAVCYCVDGVMQFFAVLNGIGPGKHLECTLLTFDMLRFLGSGGRIIEK